MAKPRTKQLYAVVKEDNKLNALEMYNDTDIELVSGEKLWIVEVKAIRVLKTKRRRRKL